MTTTTTYHDHTETMYLDYIGTIERRRGNGWVVVPPAELPAEAGSALADDDGRIVAGATGTAGGVEYRAR